MKDIFLQHLEQDWHQYFGNLASNPDLVSCRKKQFDQFVKLGLPTSKDEHWKYTNLAPIKALQFKLASSTNDVKDEISQYFLVEPHYRLVFVNGSFVAKWSIITSETSKLILASLCDATEKFYDYVKPYLIDDHTTNSNPFAKLNTACIKEGAFIIVPESVDVKKPIHILNINSTHTEQNLNHLRNIVIAQSGCKITILEEHLSMNDSVYFTNSMTNIHAEKGAFIHYTKIQNQNKKSFHIGNLEINQERESRVELSHLNLGSKIAREDVRCHLKEGSCVKIQGMYLPLNQQHIDVHTDINHEASHTASDQSYKGIVGQKSRAVFNGKIKVIKNIKQAIANLQNKNLLLSSESEVNTKPELEIYSDDVKCHHGATVGQLDQQMLFYLQSRGIPLETAYRMLLTAFINDNLTNFKHHHMIEQIKNLVTHYCEEELL